MEREIIEEIRVAIFGKNSQLLCGYTKPKSCDEILRAIVKFCIDRHFISIEAGADTLKMLEKIKREESLVKLTSNKFFQCLCELIVSNSIPYRIYKDEKAINDPAHIRGGYPIVDVTYHNGKRYILILSPKAIVKEVNDRFTDNQEFTFSEKEIISELKENGILFKDMMPKPDKNGRIKKRPNKEDLCYAIPYEKLFSNNS